MNGAKKQYERAARIAEIYKEQCDNLKELHEKQDQLLSMNSLAGIIVVFVLL